MNKFEMQRMVLNIQRETAQKEVRQWVELIKLEAERRLEGNVEVVSVSSFFEMTQRLSDAVARRESIDAQLTLLAAVE